MIPNVLFGAYQIEGRVNLGKEWQPKVYLAMIDELSDYYRASSELIVNTGLIEADGHFLIEGDELPDSPRFYRLYLMKEQNTEFDACLYVGGDDHNFIHLILDNNSQVRIEADSTFYSPFGNYSVVGAVENHLMRELSRMVYPSFYFYQIKFPTELKLSEQKLFDDLRNFADTCQNTLAALAAVVNTDMEIHAANHAGFYESFGARLEESLPENRYTQNYMRRLYFYIGAPEQSNSWVKILIVGQAFIILLLTGYILYMRRRFLEFKPEEDAAEPGLKELLTAKEAEILTLISIGKSNKEIAGELFIEVSTVKTHINKIYNKLGVRNRKEAKSVYESWL
jgi:DNA-binding CsgD family transcriptional regulator